jgi:hypothetical protein
MIRGKTLLVKDNFISKEINIQNMIDCCNKNIIVIPNFQRLINNDKIEEMSKSYYENPELFNFITNPIQLVQLPLELNNKHIYYLIDGQHRYFFE